MDKFAKDLLAAADKYQLDQLKSACAEHLCRDIDIENCISHLMMGDLYQADNLKKSSLQFISRNMKNVFQSKGWRESLRTKPDLMADVLEMFAGKASARGDIETLQEN